MSLGQDFFAINGLNLASVVGCQAAFSLLIPRKFNLAERILVQGNQKQIDEA